MANEIRTPTPSSMPTTGLSNAAAVADALGAEKLQQANKTEGEGKKDDKKADKPGEPLKPQHKATGFDALNLAGLPGKPAGTSAVAQLIMGIGNHALVEQRLEDNVDSMRLAEPAFADLAARLEKPDGKPGGQFIADYAGRPSDRDVLRIALQSAPFAFVSEEASAEQTPSVSKESGKLSDQLARVKLVRSYQQLGERLFVKQSAAADRQALLAKQNLAPQAQSQVTAAQAQVAEAMAIYRGKFPAVWSKAAPMVGSLANLQKALGTQVEALSGEVSVADIEIPSPALVQLEQGARGVSQLGKMASAATAATARAVSAVPGDGTAADGGIDFAHGDVETLAILVMMHGATVENDITTDLLQNMDAVNKQKEALRQMQTASKQNSAKMTDAIQNEYNQLKATGQIAATITMDQYKSWRSFAFAGLQDATDASGSPNFQLPAPQMTPLDVSTIPEWMKTGNVAASTTDGSKVDDSKMFGLPAQAVKMLQNLYTQLKPDGQSFEDWLQSTVGLTQAGNLDDIMGNLQAVRTFLGGSPDDVMGLPPAGLNVNKAVLDKLKGLAMDYLKAQMVSQAFPDLVDDDKLEEKHQALLDAENDKDMNTATSLAFNALMGRLEGAAGGGGAPVDLTGGTAGIQISQRPAGDTLAADGTLTDAQQKEATALAAAHPDVNPARAQQLETLALKYGISAESMYALYSQTYAAAQNIDGPFKLGGAMRDDKDPLTAFAAFLSAGSPPGMGAHPGDDIAAKAKAYADAVNAKGGADFPEAQQLRDFQKQIEGLVEGLGSGDPEHYPRELDDDHKHKIDDTTAGIAAWHQGSFNHIDLSGVGNYWGDGVSPNGVGEAFGAAAFGIQGIAGGGYKAQNDQPAHTVPQGGNDAAYSSVSVESTKLKLVVDGSGKLSFERDAHIKFHNCAGSLEDSTWDVQVGYQASPQDEKVIKELASLMDVDSAKGNSEDVTLPFSKLAGVDANGQPQANPNNGTVWYQPQVDANGNQIINPISEMPEAQWDTKAFEDSMTGLITSVADSMTFDYQGTGDSPADKWLAQQKTVGKALASGEKLIGNLLDGFDPSDSNDESAVRKWARKNGFDTDFNDSEAAKAAQNAANTPAIAGGTTALPVDPTTGVVLDQTGTLDDYNAKVQEISDKLDTLKGFTDTEQIRLQAQMDRRSKFFETLSNILKNLSNTDKTIRDNIK